MFKIDGSSHKNGVQNEKDTIDILNRLSLYNEEVLKKGGTKCKEDAVSGEKKISIKRKNGIINGSFDWVNTCSNIQLFSQLFDPFLLKVKEYKTLPKKVIDDNRFIFSIRKEFNKICNETLNTLDNSNINTFLLDKIINPNLGFDIVINDVKTSTLYVFPFKDHPINKYLSNNIILSGKAKASRKIFFTDGNSVYDCGLRLRITTNNGIKALLGISEVNKNSCLTIKVQQDNIRRLISQVDPKVYEY